MRAIEHRREIDGLRAIAILAVVLYHAVAWPAAGFVGVDIFFAISGYLITRLLLAEHATTGRIDLLAFYARRMRRILPAVLVVIIAVLGMASLLLPPDAQLRAFDSAISAALFVANFFFEFTTGGYFDPSVDSMPLMHVWSLAVEEQFYLIWPALLIAILTWRPRRIRLMIAILGLCSFLLAEIALHSAPRAAFYQMPARFWEMAAGGFIAASPLSRSRVPQWLSAASFCVVLAACAFPIAEFPGFGALPVVAATSVLLWAIHRESALGWVGTFLSSKPMVGVGLVSYSLYLWHWPLLAFYRATTIGAGSPQVRIALCGVALILAVASWRYIETPFRRLPPRGRLFTAGATCTVALAVAVWWWGGVLRQEFAAMPHDSPLAVKAENDLPPGWKRCHYQVYSTDFPRPGCETIPGKKARVVLWGDSMAMTWSPLIKELGHRLGESAIDYSRDACEPFVGYMPSNPKPADFKCRDWNRRVLEQAQGADVVVIVAFWDNYGLFARAAPDPAWFRATLLALSTHVKRIIVIGATPVMRDRVAHCIRLNAVDRCAVSRREFDAVASAVMNYLHSAARGLSNVEFIDPTNFFCTGTVCPAIKNGIPLYYDDHHVAFSAASAYVAKGLPWMDPARPYPSPPTAGRASAPAANRGVQ